MKIKLKIEREYEVKYLQVRAGVRYWEDSVVNNQLDEEGTLIPLRDGDNWCPTIEVDTGHILNWPVGTTATIHYKVCDDGEYILLDEWSNTILIHEGYVRDCMCPKDNGYGDYIIMDIDENGFIEGWEADFSDFIEDEE